MTVSTTARPALEVADVIRHYGDGFRERYAGVLSDAQRKALRDLAACRTAVLGGHVEHGLDCGHERMAYNVKDSIRSAPPTRTPRGTGTFWAEHSG